MPLSDLVFLGSHKPEEVIGTPEPYSVGTWYLAKYLAKNIGMVEWVYSCTNVRENNLTRPSVAIRD